MAIESGVPSLTEQDFLNNLDKKLWTAADRLRANLDAAVYKHVVLGLIFLKYVSDAFVIRQEELEAQFSDENHPICNVGAKILESHRGTWL